MALTPTRQQLIDALSAAASAHHDYESNFLHGVRDEHWAGWYAAYVLGRVGEFAAPTELAGLLSEVSGESDWSELAADHVLAKSA